MHQLLPAQVEACFGRAIAHAPALKLLCSSVQDAAIEEDPEEVGIVPASQQSEVLLYSEEASSLVRALAQQDDAVRQHLEDTDIAAKKTSTNCCVQ